LKGDKIKTADNRECNDTSNVGVVEHSEDVLTIPKGTELR